MLGIIFSVLVVTAFVSAGASGNMSEVSAVLIEGANEAVNLSVSMLGVMCLWSGIIRVFDKAGITKLITRMISPLIRFIYPKTYKNRNAVNDIAADFSANLLGLGNAALPLGIKAMNKMRNDGLIKPDTANDEMIMFAVINTAPFQLIPATLIALRNAHSSNNPSEIMLPIWICSLLTTAFAVIICKILSRLTKK